MRSETEIRRARETFRAAVAEIDAMDSARLSALTVGPRTALAFLSWVLGEDVPVVGQVTEATGEFIRDMRACPQ